MDLGLVRSMGERIQVVPRRYRYMIGDAVFAVTSPLYRGDAVECPVCSKGARAWTSLGFPHRLCPHCGSFERQRLLSLYLRHELHLAEKPLTMLHFAPEYCFLRYFPKLSGLTYIPADLLDPPRGTRRLDVTDIALESASVDLIICSHVLEHVQEDAKAMGELRRVLRPGGTALVLGPVDYSRPATYEDPTIVSPEARRAAFEQSDHVRVYGADFDDRLRAAGFEVDANRYAQALGADATERHGLQRDEVIYVCSPVENRVAANPSN